MEFVNRRLKNLKRVRRPRFNQRVQHLPSHPRKSLFEEIFGSMSTGSLMKNDDFSNPQMKIKTCGLTSCVCLTADLFVYIHGLDREEWYRSMT